LEGEIKSESDNQGDDNYRNCIMYMHIFGNQVNAAGIENEASGGDLSIFPGLLVDFGVGGLEGPVSIEDEIGSRTRERPAGDGDHIPNVSKFRETEENSIVKTGCNERSYLGAAELSY
jgi:hypothetical protein